MRVSASILILVLILALGFVPNVATADGHIEAEVRQAIIDFFAHTRANGEEHPDETASDGSLEFWSSGGLMHSTAADDPPGRFTSFELTPKHIEVILLGEDAAVAMYYSEGSMQPEGSPVVPHYLTRVTEVLVKEDGRWKRRAAHWSAVRGGSGTSQASPGEAEEQ